MLRVLLESALIEFIENNNDINKWIDYTYGNLDKSYTNDIEKEIKENNLSKDEFKNTLLEIFNDDDFKEELKDLGLTIN